MSFGYLLFVNTKHQSHEYLLNAYACALSIKNTQREGYDKVALVIDKEWLLEPLTNDWVFDKVIEWGEKEGWDGRSYMDKLTPWDETVCLDADVLLTHDFSHWIDYLSDTFELFLPSKAYTYRGEVITSDYYRKTFTANKLPNFYSLFTYFKKESPLATDFFTLNRSIIDNPKEFANMFLTDHKPKVIGTDEAFALSAKILGIDTDITHNLNFPRIVHLKPMIQNWPWPANKVSDHVGFYLNDNCELKIGNYQQNGVIHYNEKTLITKELISILEHKAWKKTF